MEMCRQRLSLHSKIFNAKTLDPLKTLYFVLVGARRSMSIVLKTSSWLAWTHRAEAMTLEKGWGQGVADSACVNEMGCSMPEQVLTVES